MSICQLPKDNPSCNSRSDVKPLSSEPSLPLHNLFPSLHGIDTTIRTPQTPRYLSNIDFINFIIVMIVMAISSAFFIAGPAETSQGYSPQQCSTDP